MCGCICADVRAECDTYKRREIAEIVEDALEKVDGVEGSPFILKKVVINFILYAHGVLNK